MPVAQPMNPVRPRVPTAPDPGVEGPIHHKDAPDASTATGADPSAAFLSHRSRSSSMSLGHGASESAVPYTRLRRLSAGASGETWLVKPSPQLTPSVSFGAGSMSLSVQAGASPSTAAPGAGGAGGAGPDGAEGGSGGAAAGSSSSGGTFYAMKVAWLVPPRRGEDPAQAAAPPQTPEQQAKQQQRMQRQLERARQEADCLRRCQHPLVVRYVDSRETPAGEFHLVMELVEGGDLAMQMLTRATAQPPHPYCEGEAIFYFVQACVAVRSLHRRNILHRDIKSGNFLCLRNGLLKLADFGFAKDFSPQSVVGQRVSTDFMGTPSFLAPEVWKGEGYGDRAEVWSLGILLFQLLTLQLPFVGSTMQSLSRRICRGTYVLPEGTPRISSHAQALLGQLLCIDQDRRPSLEEVLALPLMRRAMRQFCTLATERRWMTSDELATYF